jgi:hypothetical protein
MKKGTNKPDVKRDSEVLRLRRKNKLSFRKIGVLTNQDVKTVFRRYKRALATVDNYRRIPS